MAQPPVSGQLVEPLPQPLRLAAREQADDLRRPERLRDGRLDRLRGQQGSGSGIRLDQLRAVIGAGLGGWPPLDCPPVAGGVTGRLSHMTRGGLYSLW